nr:homeobox protein ESX1-like [Nothobranchius furzeri]
MSFGFLPFDLLLLFPDKPTHSSQTGRTLEPTPSGTPTARLSASPLARTPSSCPPKLPGPPQAQLPPRLTSWISAPAKPLNPDRTTPPSNQFPPLQTISRTSFLVQELSYVYAASLVSLLINPYLNILHRLRSDSVCRGLDFFTTT